MNAFFKKITGFFTLILLLVTLAGNVSANTLLQYPPQEKESLLLRIDEPLPPLSKEKYSNDLFKFSVNLPMGWYGPYSADEENPWNLFFPKAPLDEFGLVSPEGGFEVVRKDDEGWYEGVWNAAEPKPHMMIDGRVALRRDVFLGDGTGRRFVLLKVTENFPETWNKSNYIVFLGKEKEMVLLNKMLDSFEFME